MPAIPARPLHSAAYVPAFGAAFRVDIFTRHQGQTSPILPGIPLTATMETRDGVGSCGLSRAELVRTYTRLSKALNLRSEYPPKVAGSFPANHEMVAAVRAMMGRNRIPTVSLHLAADDDARHATDATVETAETVETATVEDDRCDTCGRPFGSSVTDNGRDAVCQRSTDNGPTCRHCRDTLAYRADADARLAAQNAETATAPVAETAPTAAVQPRPTLGAIDDVIRSVVRDEIAAMPQPVDADAVAAIVDTAVARAMAAVDRTPRTTVHLGDVATITLAHRVHPAFTEAMTALSAGENVMLVGPAGTGKTTLAAHLAAGFGIPFRAASGSPAMMPHDLIGYRNAVTNAYVETPFTLGLSERELFCFDEVDAISAGVLVALNTVAANGWIELPNGERRERHAEHKLVANANTWGTGASAEYVGRGALDVSTLNRYYSVSVDYDETFEREAVATYLENVEPWMAVVAKMRANRASHRIKSAMISTRDVIAVPKLVQAGLTWEQAIRGRILKGASVEDVNRLTDGVNIAKGAPR